ncbi:unnamed protein product, partial [marine sediment metagenome]
MNKYKTLQLGIPFGTACNRLRKEIIFYLSKKCGLNICYQCKKEIKNSSEMTIEHKKPWL